MKGESTGYVGALLSLPFLVAVVLLVAAAVLAGPLADLMGYTRVKKALPLKAAFGELNTGALGPYKVLERRVHQPSVVEQLGTDTYLSWTLEETDRPTRDPLQRVELNVTYYSGGHNLVPHTPDVCIVGGGYQLVDAQNMTINIPALGSEYCELPIRACTFAKTSVFQRQKFSVLYTFFCNGEFVTSRNAVRVLINNPKNVHAFFSKIEVSFPAATLEQNIEGATELLGQVLPVLIQDHWPDFKAAERAASPGDGR